MPDYAVVRADDCEDAYADSDVPGEFRRLTEALGGEQLAATLIRVPPHSDFEQGSGHFHDEVEELYIVTRGTLTMRFGDEVVEVAAASSTTATRPRSTTSGRPRRRRSSQAEGELFEQSAVA